jgi:hypothetical protein
MEKADQKNHLKKIKNKRKNRCWSSIAAHNLNRSLLGSEFDPIIFDESRKSNKINLRSKSKTKKSPKVKQIDESVADSSFQQKNSLNLSQMFNYYTNQPLLDKGSRKPNKNLLNAYKSYNNSSVSKKANANIPMNPKFAISILTNPRAHCKPAPVKIKIKNIDQPHYKSKSKYPSLMLTAINNKGKFYKV